MASSFLYVRWWTIKKVEDLSKGMAQKIQFITTVLHDPKVLILDEPLSGLDPVNSLLIKNEILELKKKNTSFLVRQLLFTPYFLDLIRKLNDPETERAWYEDFKKMIGYDGFEFSNFDERFNFLLKALGKKSENLDGLTASLKSLDKIRNNN